MYSLDLGLFTVGLYLYLGYTVGLLLFFSDLNIFLNRVLK